MNYEKIYNQLITRAQIEYRKKSCGTYFERHHIIPKCLGGDNSKTNLVLLTAREHFIAHKLLCEIYPADKSIRLAYWLMANKSQSRTQQRIYHVSSTEYQRIKIDISNDLKNRFISIETRQKMSNTRKNKKFSKQHCDAISKSCKGISKTIIHYKFTYDDYLRIYNDFIKQNQHDPTIGIEKYCKQTKYISSTTFRKFIKENNLTCPRAKNNI